MRAAIYARYGSRNQRPESIEDQMTACRKLALQNGFTVLDDHIYADQAKSGARKDRTGQAVSGAIAVSAGQGEFRSLSREDPESKVQEYNA